MLSNQTWQRKEWFSLSKAYFLQQWFTLLLLEVSDAHHIRHFLSFTPSHFHLHLFTLTLYFLSPPSRGMSKRDTDISSDGQGRKGELEQPTLRSKSWHVSPYSLATITEYVMRRKQQEHVGKEGFITRESFHPAVISTPFPCISLLNKHTQEARLQRGCIMKWHVVWKCSCKPL